MVDSLPFPKLNGRLALTCKWIPKHTKKLLDAGCSFGYGTNYFSAYSEETYGIEIEQDMVDIAKQRYPNINFLQGALDDLPFENNTFDALICTDVLEHVPSEIPALNELFRVLKPRGTFILTTPHKGLFTLLDPYNYGYYLRKNFTWLYKILYKILTRQSAFKTEPGYKHRHYTKKELTALLDASSFNGHYSIEKVFRSGLLAEVIAMNIELAAQLVFKSKSVLKFLEWMKDVAAIDFNIPYGVAAYNIAILIRKK
ncbi:MAG: class I SAM-dependent methyltransferase [Ignavibacteriae bacterium]|nr:class I SAM-dependent methyltransferase [Ignavibacteriota bacterium]